VDHVSFFSIFYFLFSYIWAIELTSFFGHRFDTEFFFLVLLPPVIFESGYTLNPETLFRNFDAISVFAFLGTFVSTLVVGFIMYGAGMAGLAYQYTLRWVHFINSRMGNSRLTCFVKLRDAMLFGSLISSTDPVTTLSIFSDMGLDPDLHAVVLGESLLNDAISIVLFEALFMFGKESATGGGIPNMPGAESASGTGLGVDSLETAVNAAMGAHGASSGGEHSSTSTEVSLFTFPYSFQLSQ
jgi:hypothetical protein